MPSPTRLFFTRAPFEFLVDYSFSCIVIFIAMKIAYISYLLGISERYLT